MVKTPKEHLEQILARNPDLFFASKSGDRTAEEVRDVGLDLFCIIGRALLKDAEEVYLTGHTPESSRLRPKPQRSYRLWLRRPAIFSSGHPDWHPKTGVVETASDHFTDYNVVSNIIGNQRRGMPEAEVVRNPHSDYCKETRIYRLK